LPKKRKKELIMFAKLNSRKLGVFVLTFLTIVLNYALTLGMPEKPLLYLAIAAASYILGQGFVDAKQQPVKELPVADITSALADIVRAELVNTPVGKTLPLDELTAMFQKILATEMSKINAFTVSPAAQIIPITPIDQVPINT
jgi:hypothetical protein